MDDEHHQKNDSSMIMRSTVPFIEIDSLFIDLTSCIDKADAGNCDHFSIREYASQMREKDWKRCWPFDLDGDNNSEEETSLLPPFHVPHFRLWRCQNCRKETTAGFDQPSNLDMIDGSVAVANSSMNLCGINHPLSISIEKEKKAEGHELDSRQILNPEIPLLIRATPEVNSSLMLEQNKSDTVLLNLEHRESTENCELLCGNEVAEVELGFRNLKVIEENAKVFDVEKRTPTLNGQTEITFLASSSVKEMNQARNRESDPANVYPAELDVHNATASEYNEISAENDFQDHHTDKSGSLHRRKTRKVRLLTELLNENGNIKTNYPEAEECPSLGTAEKSEGLKELSVPQCPVAFKKNIRSINHNIKCKLPLDEDRLPPEVTSSYKMNNKFQASKGDVETKDSVHAIGSENALIGTGLQSKKSFLNKCRIEGKSLHGKKKNKKTQLDACSSLGGPLETDDNMSNISLKHNEFAGSSVDPFLLFGSRIEPISCMSKKKSKMPVIDEGQGLTWNISMHRRDSVALKEVEIRNNEPLTVPSPSVPDESSERGLHLSLNSYLATPRNDKKSIPQANDGSHCLLSWQGSTSKASGVRNKYDETKNLTDSNVPFNVSDNFPGQGFDSGPNSKMTTTSCRMHFLNEKKNSNFQVKHDGWSQLQPMDNSVINKFEKSISVPEHLAAKIKQGDQMVGKVSEQRALDDIPMEIVELMAKNQYERCLDNSEINKPLSKTSSRKAQIMNFSNANGHSGFSQEKMSHKWKPMVRDGRNDIFTAGDNVGYGKQSSGNYFSHAVRGHFNVKHLHQTVFPPEFTGFFRSQNNSSNGVKYLASGTSENGCAHYKKYTGGMADQESSHSRLQTFGGCNTQLPVSQKNVEVPHLWAETLPNHHTCVSTTPKKVAAQSTSMKICKSYPESGSKAVMNRDKIFNLNSANLEKDDGNCGFENDSRSSAKHPSVFHSKGIELPENWRGSLDLYSNETIPAMHLLSLMDAGMQRNEASGTPKIPKKPYSHDKKSKEISALDIGLFKTFDTINYSCNYYGEIHPSKKSHDSFHAASLASSSISPLIRSENFDVAADLTGKVALQSKQKEMTKCSTSTWNRGKKSQKSVYASGFVGSNKGVFPIHSLQKKFGDASSSLVAVPGYHRVEKSGQCIIEHHGTKRMLDHLEVSSEFGICSINKNPAEFSTPEAGNMYMIGAEDLKFSKRNSPEKRSHLVNMDRRKRRNVKRNVVKEHALHYNL